MKKKLHVLVLLTLILTLFVSVVPVEAASSKNAAAYKAYTSWIKKGAEYQGTKYNKFALVNIDNDSVPELIAQKEFDSETTYRIFSYKKGKLVTQRWENHPNNMDLFGAWVGDVSYIPKKGKLYQSWFNRGDGRIHDEIYTLTKKGFSLVEGNYHRLYDNSKKWGHIWKGKSVSEATYNKKLKKAFNSSKAKSFDKINFKSKKAILKKLK